MSLLYTNLHRFLVLMLLLAPLGSAWGFVEPPTFSPAQPNADQAVDMSVRVGDCHGFAAPPAGYPFVDVQVNGDIISVIITGVEETDPIFCVIPPYTEAVNIGGFPEGSYTVRISIRDIDIPYPVLPPISEAPLVVFGVPAQPAVTAVPVNSPASLLLLAGITLGIAVVMLRKSSGTLFGVLLALSFVFPLPTKAQTDQNEPLVIVEILRSENGPSPQDVVDGFDPSSDTPPPLDALSIESPEEVQYFIPTQFRAKGDFKIYLDANPELPRARLEQMVLVRYPATANIETAVTALRADNFIRYAKVPIELELILPPDTASKTPPGTDGTAAQYWIDAMRFTQAWSRAGGWARIGVLDGGLYTDHPDLKSQNANGSLTGGNFLPMASADIGRHGYTNPIDFNVDELEPVPVTTSTQICDDGGGFMIADVAGHGTHVHGLLGANHANTDGTVGACKNCGLASFRVLRDICLSSGIVYPRMNQAAPWFGLALLAQTGAQVVNMSFGGRNNGTFTYPDDFCIDSAYDNDPECLAIAYANSQGVMMVAASGNNRGKINFPASDPRVVSVGGLDESLNFWNEDADPPPNHMDDCPYPNMPGYDPNTECGSNYTINASSTTEAKQEHTAPARRVLSTLYPGMFWNNDILCDDAALGTPGDGKGPCTGTSMSAPLVSGLAGILRSINPLVLPGEGIREPAYRGIRSVLIEGSALPSILELWNPKLGYGIPLADMAVDLMLGASDRVRVKNRLTPLFSFYSPVAKDWAYTTVPQVAHAYMINSPSGYQPQGSVTPGYSNFPYEWPTPPPSAPRASTYVLTTEYKTNSSHPNLVPLYWMTRDRAFPVGCAPGVPGCNGDNRDFILLTSTSHVQIATNAGYAFMGRQGYVYQICTPEATCVPQGAERLWLKCKTTDDDCAVFLERERTSFEAQGYTAAFSSGQNMLLGYAYPNVDTDGDGLVDGFEYILGTNSNNVDSDSDGINDGVEYPQAGVPESDPCSAARCRVDYLFADGFGDEL